VTASHRVVIGDRTSANGGPALGPAQAPGARSENRRRANIHADAPELPAKRVPPDRRACASGCDCVTPDPVTLKRLGDRSGERSPRHLDASWQRQVLQLCTWRVRPSAGADIAGVPPLVVIHAARIGGRAVDTGQIRARCGSARCVCVFSRTSSAFGLDDRCVAIQEIHIAIARLNSGYVSGRGLGTNQYRPNRNNVAGRLRRAISPWIADSTRLASWGATW
jgi:hypothetical protein